MNIAKSSLKILATKLLNSVSGFLAVVIFSRELGASPLGIYYAFVALLGILAIPANFGFGKAVEKKISENNNKGEFLAAGLLVRLPIILIMSIAILASDDYINQYLGADLAGLLVIALIIQGIGGYGISVLKGELRVGETAVAGALRPLGWLIAGYWFLIQGFGLTGIVYGYIIGLTAEGMVGWWKTSVQPTWPKIKHIKSLFDFGRWSVIGSVSGLVYSWMDVLILTAFVSLNITSNRAEVGAYENAWRVSLLLAIISRSISVTIFPQISRWDANELTDKIESLLPRALLPGLLIVPPGLVGTIVLGKDILRILFGPEFTVAWIAMIILTGEKFFQSVEAVVGQALAAVDHPELGAIATAISLILNIMLNIALIYFLGIVGAAIATGVSMLINAALQTYYLNQYIKVRMPTQEITWSIFSALIMGTAIYALYLQFPINSVTQLLLIVTIGAVIYGCFMLLHSPLRQEAQSIFRSVVQN